MIRYSIFQVYLLLILGFTSFSQQVSLETARKVASDFVTCNMTLDGSSDLMSYQVTDCFIKSQNDQAVYFVFNLSPQGFIIISGDYRAVPVLAYSFDNNYYPNNLSPALQAWMDGYSDQLISFIAENNPDHLENNELWKEYLSGSYSESSIASKDPGVDPLIRSIWEQGKMYNDSCPEHPDGPGGHCYAGCVAISLAQVMFYYRYPEMGTGSITYVYYDTIYANFGNITFRWNEMVNNIQGLGNPAMADLIFKAGAAVQTAYSPYGSGSYTSFCPGALMNYFKYDSSAVYYNRSDTLIEWKDTLLRNLDNLQPVIYAGGAWPGAKHSFICDGYHDTSYFHFNFGWWDGSGNGYYYLDDITPFHYNFSSGQNAVFNIFPGNDYPPYAPDYDTLTAPRGTFEDGSGPLHYLNNIDSYWLIESEDSSQIMLYFDSFDTSPEDILTIYDGADTNSSVLDVFSGNDMPETITSTGNRMLIHFYSDEQDNDQGWYAHYISILHPFCQEWREYTDTVGYIYDGSGLIYDYTNLTNCYWYIHPQGYTSDSISGITLFIHEFATEESSDLLTIYEGPTINHPVLEIISGFDYPEEISTSSNEMLISFKTNESITNSGFLATYRAQLPIYCQDTVLITANAGIVNDGSGSKLYSNNSDCYWLIKTEEADTISLIFTEFDLEYGYDWIEVTDPNASPPILLRHSTGNQIPQEVKANHGAMLIHFHSDMSITKPGWEAQFAIGSQNIQETDKVKLITIRPNPANEHVHLDIFCLEEVNLDFEMINITGYRVAEGTQLLKRGENTITIDCQNLPADLYILKLGFEGSIIHRKVIVQ